MDPVEPENTLESLEEAAKQYTQTEDPQEHRRSYR